MRIETIWMAPPDLVPCPHCGGKVDFHRHSDGSHCCLILCDECRAKFDFTESVNDAATMQEFVEQIVLKWNARCIVTADMVRDQVMNKIPEDVKRKYF